MRSLSGNKERGIALFVVMMALLLVTAIGAGMVLLSNTEINVNSNYRDEQTALFAAKAGIEEGRDRMSTSNPSPITLPTVLPGASGAYATYITATGVSPWSSTDPYQDNEILKEMGISSLPAGSYTSTATSTSYSGSSTNPVPYKWVRVNLKIDRSAYSTGTPYYVDGNSSNAANQVCWDTVNLHETVKSTGCTGTLSPVYAVTSYAVTPSGTHRMLQSEVVHSVVNLTIPGALTIDGSVGSGGSDNVCSSGSTCNSGGAYLTGDEPASCATGSTVPAIATADPTSTTNLQTDISSNKSNMVGTGGSPSVVNEASALTNLSTVSEIEALVSQLTALAGSNVGPSCSLLNLGTSTHPTIAVVTNAGGSACSLSSGTTGYGILVVTGTLDYVNVNSYEGVILMLGTAQFISSSSKDTTMTGAIFMAQDRDPSSGALLAGPGLGSPTFNYHHGGASSTDPSIQFNQCVISQVEGSVVPGYEALLQRELMF